MLHRQVTNTGIQTSAMSTLKIPNLSSKTEHREEQHSAQQTLYTALEGGLTLVHPFMPFLTEELWQRLPRRPGDSCPSIVKAAYPIYQQSLDDEASEEAYELILGVSKSIRSLAAEYDIKDNANIKVLLSSPQALKTCNTQQLSIRSLGGKTMTGTSASLSILSNDDPKPTGCVVQAVNADAAVYLLIKGRVDIDAEILKAKGRLEKANQAVAKSRKMRDGDGWGKMKKEAQENEERKLEDALKEAEVLGGSVAQFERLELE